jgi:hypothetical protein
MISNRTLLELVRLTDTFDHPRINRLMAVFSISQFNSQGKSITAKGTDIYFHFKYKGTGPFSEDGHKDLIQYLVDDFFARRGFRDGSVTYNGDRPPIRFENAFSETYLVLSNGLKRDGYVVEGDIVKKLLPKEIEEAKIESELEASLDKFNFSQTKGHLSQAVSAHSQGNWASANSQFRTFIESLLIEINNYLLPGNPVSTAAKAIKLLSETASPPFLRTDLNEVAVSKDDDAFVSGLWVRLHPDGSHPGLSDEDDCSFRYHISVIFANYLLRRLKDRKKVST